MFFKVKKHKTNFETQCVSDTQLVELVQNIEENDINTEMVEDFYTSFDDISSKEVKHDEKYILVNTETKDKEESQKLSEQVLISNIVNNSYCLKTNQENCLRSQQFTLVEDVSNAEVVTKSSNIIQDIYCKDIKLQVINACSALKDICTGNNCKRMNEADLEYNNFKRDLTVTHLMEDVKPSKEVVFKSENIYEPVTASEYENKNFNLIPNEEELNFEDDVNIPLSLLLNDKKKSRIKIQKNDRCCTKNKDNANEYKENKDIGYPLFIEHCDSHSTDKQVEKIDLHINVLKDTNFKLNTKPILKKENNILNINEKDNVSVIQEPFTEDIKFDDNNVKENENTVSCGMLKKLNIKENCQANVTDIDKTFDGGIKIKRDSCSYFKNTLDFQNYTNDILIDNKQQSDQNNKEKSILKEGTLLSESDSQILENFTLNTENEELLTQPSLIENKSIKSAIVNHTKPDKENYIKNHMKLVKTFSDDNQIAGNSYTKIQTIPSSYSKGRVEQSTSPKDKRCSKETINSSSESKTNEEKENNETSFSKNIDVKDTRSTSPTFNTKNINKKSFKPSTMVYDLKCFENFENIAFSLLESTRDMKVVKQLINSQILNDELHLCGNENIQQCDAAHPLVVTENGFSNEFTVHQEVDESKLNKISNIKTNTFHNAIGSKSIEDEILFSSDEESEFIHKKHKELPLTCVAEKSFHNSSSVLDRTMFVGFETASKKIIQVFTDSYIKAQNLLGIGVEGKSINELVHLIDNKGTSNNSDSKITHETYKVNLCSTTPKQNDSYLKISEAISIKNENILDYEKDVTNQNDIDRKANTGYGKKSSQNINNLNLTKEYLKNTHYEGFKTASNKNIKLSDIALAKCKTVFSNINLDDDFNSKSAERLFDENNGLAWTENPDWAFNNKTNSCIKDFIDIDVNNVENLMQVNITDEVIIQEFENVEMSLEEKKDKINESQTSVSSSNKAKTNGNISIEMKPVGETEALLEGLELTKIVDKYKKNKNTYLLDSHNDNGNRNCQTSIFSDILMSKGLPFSGFKTASNKGIKISDTALLNSKKLFSDMALNEEQEFKSNIEIQLYNDKSTENSKTMTLAPLPELSENQLFKGFQTASNKPIKISEESLKKTKSIFNDIDIINTDINDNISESIENNIKTNLQGHETFNYKSDACSISETPFKDCNNLIKHTDSNETTKPIVELVVNNVKNSNNILSMSTSNNGRVIISKELNKSKDFSLPNSHKDSHNNNNNPLYEIKTEVPAFKGFQTANNKLVTISKEALQNSKNIFKDILFDPFTNDNQNKSNKVEKSSFKGFQTANNMPVNVSNEALKITKDLFENIDIPKTFDEFTRNDAAKEIPTFKGFQTANNKPVKVSSGALLKSKNIFQDIILNEDFSECVSALPMIEKETFQGFKTASNKKVAVSRQALEKCKNIFDDLNLTTELFEKDIKISSHFSNKKDVFLQNENEALNCKTIKSDDINNDAKTSTMSNRASELMINSHILSSDKNVFSVEDVMECNESQRPSKIDVNKENDVKVKEGCKFNVGHSDNHLNTQLLDNFDDTLYTEDFHTTPVKANRRSVSPILSCPKAKKRKKFEVPYKACTFTKKILQPNNLEIEKNVKYEFDNNYKKCKKYALKDLINIEAEFKLNNTGYKNIKAFKCLEDINLKSFKFAKDRNDINDGSIALKEFKRIFENSVDMKIVPDNWFENHMKMILWKLFDYENDFPHSMKNVCTAKNVLEQLKYRYDVELYNAKRPALRRILEKDDLPSKLIILKVIGIYVDDTATYW